MTGGRIYVEEFTDFILQLFKTIEWDRRAPAIVSQR